MNLQNSLKGIVALTVLLGSTAFAADIKVGVIDMQKAIQSTKAGKAAKEQLEKDFNKKKKELEKIEADLKKMSEDFEKKSLVLSDDVKLKKQQDLQKEMIDYRELVGKSQIDIQKKERELTVPIIKKLKDVVSKIAEKDGFTVILEKSEQSVMWAKKEIDITDQVIKETDK